MSRYIDADALLSKGHFVVRTNDFGERFVTVEEINKMPTVDAVQVVRCKECIEYRDSVGACHYFNYEPTDEMDFCSHGILAEGERREE